MINLLPPEIKEQIAYAKRNAVIVKYVWLVIFVIVGLAVIFGGSGVYLRSRIAAADNQAAEKQKQLQSYSDLQSRVKLVNDRISSLRSIQGNQAKLSNVLKEIAAKTPSGAFISTITLTGDDKKPVGINASATSYNQAVALRDALASSPRVAEADITSVTQSGGRFNIQINLGFKPGQAK